MRASRQLGGFMNTTRKNRRGGAHEKIKRRGPGERKGERVGGGVNNCKDASLFSFHMLALSAHDAPFTGQLTLND